MRTAVALALAWGLAVPLSAQVALPPGAVEPRFDLTPDEGPGAWALEIDVPEGWALYAPDSGHLGRPLVARWIGEADPVVAPLDAPPGRMEASSAGPVAVYRGRVTVGVAGGSAGSETLEVRWALCRHDLCVPGATRIPVPPEPSAPGACRQKIR